jgi:hypothetical protein
MTAKLVAATFVILGIGGCAVRLGGPSPEPFQTLAYASPAGEAAADAAARIQSAAADIVLLTSPNDSAWFADVATRTQLALSGPGRTSTSAKAFLTRRLELLGDTSIVLSVNGGGRIHMHDALYQISEDRHVDLMLLEFDGQAELREAVRTLLSYVATDVGPTAAIIFALAAPTAQAADSAAVLLRAAYENGWECVQRSSDGAGATGGAAPAIALRLFFGPVVRMDCDGARVLSAPGNPISAQLVVGR